MKALFNFVKFGSYIVPSEVMNFKTYAGSQTKCSHDTKVGPNILKMLKLNIFMISVTNNTTK